MSDDLLIDDDTGEVFASTSEAAISMSKPKPSPPPARLNAALMAAIKNMPAWITAEKDNMAFKAPTGKVLKYATLKQILESVRPHLHEQGIRIKQGMSRSWPNDEGGGSKGRLIPVYTMLVHSESGEFDETLIEIPLSVMSAQAMGSAITYGRRYSLLAALGLATDEADDDGETAKPKRMSERHEDSADLATMTREMNATKDATKLIEWSDEPKQQSRFAKLSTDEQAILKQRYEARARAIATADDQPQPVKKGKAAE
jgi:hypothetical protein